MTTSSRTTYPEGPGGGAVAPGKRLVWVGLRPLLELVGAADALGSLLSNVLQANLTEVSVRQNDDMRRISAWVAIWAVPTLLAGVYG